MTDSSGTTTMADDSGVSAKKKMRLSGEGDESRDHDKKEKLRDEPRKAARETLVDRNVGTMSNYKLTYFDGRGRAELSRLIFAMAGVQYEDVRIQQAEWGTLKPTTPFGQMPLLDVDGVLLCQSKCVARFLARRYDLAGKSDVDQARADMIVDCIDDTIKPIFHPGYYFETDPEKKAAMKKKYLEEQLPVSLAALEKLLIANNDGNDFFVGNELTWADLALFDLGDFLTTVDGSSQLTDSVKLNALREKVAKLPKVAEWIAKRPGTAR